MEKRQLALFVILILSGLSLGQLLNLEIIGVILALLGAVASALWVDYDVEDTEGKDAKSV
ncbi:hypothetical protein [Enterococcus sp. HY326]|uniref:hypothetical protein n=1 Tax=Enterococcus sp. HY326 TaxID=2971265 RepID=UPI00223EDD62|nr:hypothetical protein [Enterococcus sp. HY326]